MKYCIPETRNKNIICIIPARGGSKGVPKKNIRSIKGEPLISYTIRSAIKSKLLDKVIVSTEDDEIAAISKQYGAEIINRPIKLSEDETPTEPVIIHAVSVLECEGYKPDIIVTLQPTSPLRTANQIDEAVGKIMSEDVDSVISLKEVREHPYKMKRIEGDRVVPFLSLNLKSNRRQDMPILYKENGAIYVTKYELLMEKQRIIGDEAIPYIMCEKTSLDIDTELDFQLAECLL
jgi:CMP-N-acetylneuraminic acid synthetase